MMHVKAFGTAIGVAAMLALPSTAALAASGGTSGPQPSDSQGYGDAVSSRFVDSCVRAGSPDSRSFCQCLMKELRTNVPYKQFSAMDREYRTGQVSDQTRSRMAKAADACTSS